MSDKGGAKQLEHENRLGKFVSNITVEPIIFLFGFGLAIQSVINSALYYEKICKVGSFWFGNGSTYPDEICDHLDNGEHEHIQNHVQKLYAKATMTSMYLQGFPPIVMVLLIGSWSDRGGRKLAILMPLIGFMFYDLSFLINAIYYRELSVEYLMIECVQDWFGGSSTIFLGCYCYLSDVTKERTRISRLAWMDAGIIASFGIGAAVGGHLYAAVGYVPVYILGLICHITAFLYGLLYLKESRILSIEPSENGKEKNKEKMEESETCCQVHLSPCKGIFSVKHALDSFKELFKKRDGGMRHIVVMLVFQFMMYAIVHYGMNFMLMTYARKKFVWESMTYFATWWSTYSAIGSKLFTFLTLVFIVPFINRVFNVDDFILIILSFVGMLLALIIILMAEVPELFYLASFFEMFNDTATISIRVALTKIVGVKDIGKIFACIGALQTSVSLILPLFNLLYLATFHWHLGFIFCFCATLMIFMIAGILYMYSYVQKNKDTNKEKALEFQTVTTTTS